MNKKLLTAAIAAVIAAPTAALANDVTVYGVVHASVDYRSEDSSSLKEWTFVTDERSNLGTYVRTVPGTDGVPVALGLFPSWWGQPTYPGDASDGFDIASRATRIGFKGTEDLANGLKAIWKMEFQIDIADRGGSCVGNTDLADFATSGSIASPTVNQGNRQGQCDSGQLVSARNAYIGLAGGWGTFLVGRHDTPYKMSTAKLDFFADTLADNNSTIGFVDIRTNSAIAYVSPSWNGLSFAGAIVAPHTYYADTYAVLNPITNAPEAARKVSDADGLAEAYSLALSWDYAGFFASVGYEVLSGTWWDSWGQGIGYGIDNAYSWNNAAYFSNSSEDNDKWRVGLGWTGAGFTIGGIYEWESNILGQDGADGERWQILAGYTFGNNMIKAMYGQGDADFSSSFTGSNTVDPTANNGLGWIGWTGRDNGHAERSAWAIGLDHNFSKRTKAYMLYTAVDASADMSYAEFNNGLLQDGATKSKLDANTGGFSIGMVHSF
jgi:predicted porin